MKSSNCAIYADFTSSIIVIIALRLASFDQAGLSTDPTLLESQFITWTLAELNYSIISATIPILRPFVTNLSTHYGGGHGQGDDSMYGYDSSGSHARSKGRSAQKGTFEMRSMNRSKSREVREQEDDERYAPTNYSYGVVTGRQTGNLKSRDPNDTKADATSVNSNDSQKMIIRKDITWQIQHNM